jgi:hypothetical protein
MPNGAPASLDRGRVFPTPPAAGAVAIRVSGEDVWDMAPSPSFMAKENATSRVESGSDGQKEGADCVAALTTAKQGTPSVLAGDAPNAPSALGSCQAVR